MKQPKCGFARSDPHLAYNNASEIISDALRLKMQQDEIYIIKLEALRTAIIHGEQSGDAVPFDIQNIIQEAKKDAGLNG